MDGKRIGGKVR